MEDPEPKLSGRGEKENSCMKFNGYIIGLLHVSMDDITGEELEIL